MINILIADDHPIVRQGLKQILSEEPDVATVGEARNCHEVIELLHQRDWDAVILDITMPDRGGLDVLKELKQQYPKLPVLILSMHPEDQYAIRCLKAGAAGYITKGNEPEELLKAVRKIITGGKYVSPALGEKLAFRLETETEKSLHETLSDREYQVMLMIGSGSTISDIAERLSLSVKTIGTYRARILQKMGMKNNADLAHYAVQNRLIE